MQLFEPIKYGNIYHIYNRGINSGTLFQEPTNYEYFFNLYTRHINPIADTFAWVLMKNHFHFLVRIKKKDEIQNQVNRRISIIPPHMHFSNLFNAYAKAYNKRYQRTGSLFEKRFKRNRVWEKDYFKTLVVYIHKNPVHHKIVNDPVEYSWSSYLSYVSLNPAQFNGTSIKGWFDSTGEFRALHKEINNFKDIDHWLRMQ